jgi:hypothetical protein
VYWRTTYETTARRHRELARAARAAQFVYLAVMHERAAELLEAEASLPMAADVAPDGLRAYQLRARVTSNEDGI